MNDSFYINLHNWRCFLSQKFHLPDSSFTIIDENGSGKTSLLASLYVLLKKKSWPGTSLTHNLKSGQSYFGVTTNYPDWFFNGQINPSGRISTKYQKPDEEIELLGTTIKPIDWPKVLTYIPTDNYWFNQSRSQKLAILNNLLAEIYGEEYEQELRLLEKQIASKSKLIKYSQENSFQVDQTLLKTLNQQTWYSSRKLWKYRADFFRILQEKLPDFSSWVENKLDSWQVKWYATDELGRRVFKSFENKLTFNKNDNSEEVLFEGSHNKQPDFESLWQKEQISGKVLFGAQRDDFSIESNHLPIHQVFSRGEMRLFVLFVKSLIFNKVNDGLRFWWFLDDIFNEFDSQRERILFQKVISKAERIVATSTKKPDIDMLYTNIKSLTFPQS